MTLTIQKALQPLLLSRINLLPPPSAHFYYPPKRKTKLVTSFVLWVRPMLCLSPWTVPNPRILAFRVVKNKSPTPLLVPSNISFQCSLAVSQSRRSKRKPSSLFFFRIVLRVVSCPCRSGILCRVVVPSLRKRLYPEPNGKRNLHFGYVTKKIGFLRCQDRKEFLCSTSP